MLVGTGNRHPLTPRPSLVNGGSRGWTRSQSLLRKSGRHRRRKRCRGCPVRSTVLLLLILLLLVRPSMPPNRVTGCGDDEVPVDSQYPTSLTVLALLQDSAGNAKWDQMWVISEEASSSTPSKWKRVSCKGGAGKCLVCACFALLVGMVLLHERDAYTSRIR